MRAATSFPVWFALAACGRLGFDATTDGGAPADAELDAPAPGCAVPAITDVATAATTGGASLFAGSCGGASAPELVLPFEVPAGAEAIISADDPNQDTVVYLARGCPPTAEIACDQDSGAGEGGMLSAKNLPAGRHYAFIDGQQPSAGNAVTGRIEVLLPAGAACMGVPAYWRCGPELNCMSGVCATPFSCPGSAGTVMNPGTTSLFGSTVGELNLHASSCGAVGNGGRLAPEKTYTLQLASAVSNVRLNTDFPATTDFDTLVYVRRTCFADDIECGDDNVNGVLSTVDTGALAAGTYMIVVDGFSYRSGSFRLDVTITP